MNINPIFVAQFEPAETTEARIANRGWENQNLPEWNWCGICCVRMILLGLGRTAVPALDEMYRTAFDRYGVFRMENNKIIGAYHRELAEFMRREFALDAACVRGQSLGDLARLVAGGSCFIASVSSEIRRLDGPEPERRNGHLVLVYGVHRNTRGRSFLIHNSTGYSSLKTQSAVLVPEERFRVCFSGNGIIVS